MTVRVVRKSLDGRTVRGPHLCARPGRIAREPGLLSLEELFAVFLDAGEAASQDEGEHGRWKIVRDERITGYFQIVD